MLTNEDILRCFWFSDWKHNPDGSYSTTHISEDHNLVPMFQRISDDLKFQYGANLSVVSEHIAGEKRWDMSPASPNKTKYSLLVDFYSNPVV